ncbi:hypothetical protein M404DRAFT_999802, partial [Pisolithus tinctorius Marx 270]
MVLQWHMSSFIWLRSLRRLALIIKHCSHLLLGIQTLSNNSHSLFWSVVRWNTEFLPQRSHCLML